MRLCGMGGKEWTKPNHSVAGYLDQKTEMATTLRRIIITTTQYLC